MAAAIRREDGKGVRLEDMNLRLASKIRIGVAKDKDCYILDDKLTKCAHEWYREHIERLSDYDVGPDRGNPEDEVSGCMPESRIS